MSKTMGDKLMDKLSKSYESALYTAFGLNKGSVTPWDWNSNNIKGGINMFKEILDEMLDIYTRKNADYGNSFDKSLDEDGLLVAKIRLGDKYNRFSQLIKSESQVTDESLEDTLIDMANYAIMTVMWMRNQDNQMVMDLDTPDILGTSASNYGADFDGDKYLETLEVGTMVEIINSPNNNHIGRRGHIVRVRGTNPVSYYLDCSDGSWSRDDIKPL